MNFAITTVWFTSVTFLTKQLNISNYTLSAARVWNNMIILKALGASTTFANTTISGKNNFFCCFWNMAALRKTTCSAK
jgi:hypothetical protein